MACIVRRLGTLSLLAALAACSSGSSNPSTSNAPNPNSTTVTLTLKGGGLYDQAVTLSRSIVNGGPGGVISILRTNHAGQVFFTSLPSSGQLCVFSSMVVGGTLYKVSHCAQPFPASYALKYGPHVP
ncbi:MAG: hypothetical protein WAK11_02195 [Candidatus Cybelea sp.]